jgi:hypothetical protein
MINIICRNHHKNTPDNSRSARQRKLEGDDGDGAEDRIEDLLDGPVHGEGIVVRHDELDEGCGSAEGVDDGIYSLLCTGGGICEGETLYNAHEVREGRGEREDEECNGYGGEDTLSDQRHRKIGGDTVDPKEVWGG